jgi:hypothetical protein
VAFVAAGCLRLVHADTIRAREQARDFHNLQARRLWKSENLQHCCCSNYMPGGKENHPRHTFRFGGRGQLGGDVALKRRVGDLIVGVGGVEHAETVVVFRGEYHVALAGSLGQANPGPRIEFHRIEPLRQRPVFRFGDAPLRLWFHDRPGSLDTGQRIRPPVDKHAEFGFAIPFRPVHLGRTAAVIGPTVDG